MEYNLEEMTKSMSKEIQIECTEMPESLVPRFEELLIRLAAVATELGIGLKSVRITLSDLRATASGRVEAYAAKFSEK